MNSVFKKRICDLFGWSDECFDNIFSKKPFRAIRINPLKADLNTVQTNFDVELKAAPFYKDSYYIPKDFDGVGN